MLVQVVHVLEDPVLKGGTDVDVVEDREVLHVLAPTPPACGQTGTSNFLAIRRGRRGPR